MAELEPALVELAKLLAHAAAKRDNYFSPKRGAIVHFAVDQDNVSMTTRLMNGKTRFLPFNRGRDGGAGNPDIPNENRVAYLYKDLPETKAVFSREVLLDLIGRFIHLERDGSEVLIFPRFQQLDAVRRILADAKVKGAGENYPLHEAHVIYCIWLEMGKPTINSDFLQAVRDRLLSRPKAKWLPSFLLREAQTDRRGKPYYPLAKLLWGVINLTIENSVPFNNIIFHIEYSIHRIGNHSLSP